MHKIPERGFHARILSIYPVLPNISPAFVRGRSSAYAPTGAILFHICSRAHERSAEMRRKTIFFHFCEQFDTEVALPEPAF